MGPRLPKTAVALLMLLTVARGLIYALVIPPWQTPDEPSHFGYARYVMAMHQLPVPEGASVDSAITVSMSNLDFWRLRYYAAEPSPAGQEHALRIAGRHPPLYYVLGAFLLIPLRDQDVVCQLYALRFCSVLMAASTVLVAFCTAKLLFPHDAVLPLAVAAFIAFLPMHTFMSASVNNDNLAQLFTSLLIYLLVLMLRDGMSPAKAIGVILLLTGGLFTKRTTFFAAPLALAFIPVYFWTRMDPAPHAAVSTRRLLASLGSDAARLRRTVLRSHKLRHSLAIIALLGLICGGLWPFITTRRDGRRDNATAWIKAAATERQYLPLSTKQPHPPLPNRLEVTVHQILKLLRVSLVDLEGAFSAEQSGTYTMPSYLLFSLLTFASFWANFGWMNVPLGPAWYALLAAISLFAFLGLLLRIVRDIRSSGEQTLLRCRWQKGALVILILASFLILVQTFGLMVIQNTPQQGRYLFPAILPLSTLFILGLTEVVPPRYRHGLPLISVLSLFLFDALCLVGYIVPQFYA